MQKVSHNIANVWHCTKFDGEFPECDYRYILKIDLEDTTRNIFDVISFDDAANQLMGVTAKNICLLSNEPTTLPEIVHSICS